MSDRSTWCQVDSLFEELCFDEPDFLKSARRAAKEARLPEIAVTPSHGKFLAFLIQLSGAKRVLELGTLGGYSTLWMAQAMPVDGRIVTLDNNPVCAGVARANFAHAGYAEQIELRYGDAIDNLKALVGEKGDKFDFIFIDANKSDYPMYLDWCIRLAAPNALIVADNIVRGGGIVDENTDDDALKGVREFHRKVGCDRRLDASPLQLVGEKGYDGISLIRHLGS